MNQVLQLEPNRLIAPNPVMVSELLTQPLQEWYIHHHLYDCPVYIWLAEGTVKIKKNVTFRAFLYIEYRDVTRASQYRALEFQTLESAIHFVKQQADTVHLPRISPAMTRRYPIVGS